MNKIFTRFTVLFVGLCTLFSCNNKVEPTTPEENKSELKEGMEMYSQMFLDDQLVEESIDRIINFGTEEKPALFHVNLKHSFEGQNVPEGIDDMYCSF